jgi:betaine reductase
LCEEVAAELSSAKKAGLDEEIAALTPKLQTEEEDAKAPPAEPTDEEIHGIDVLEIENAVKCLWKEGIYAESAMGCTGPVVKLSKKHEEKARELLKQNAFI